jgi:hypothetical protein
LRFLLPSPTIRWSECSTLAVPGQERPGLLGGPVRLRCRDGMEQARKREREKRLVVYLVIMVLVAVLGIMRLWLQQRREQSQMDTIEGFSSALEAIKPEMGEGRVGEISARRARRSPVAPRSRRTLFSWFVSRPDIEGARRAEARRRIEARRQAHEAARARARHSYRSPAPRGRDIAYETIDLVEDRVQGPQARHPAQRRVPSAAGQMSYSSRYRPG